MDFLNATFDRSDEYRAFILGHDRATKTEKAAWIHAAKTGAKVIPYCCSYPEDEPDRDPQFYLEYVDDDLNIYVDFFDRDTEEWVDSYRYKDPKMSWTIYFDNWVAGNPLGLAIAVDEWRMEP
jgi:hypothetical protein